MENMNYEQWDSPSEMETAFNAEAVPHTEVIPDATSPPDRETIVEMEEAVNESSGQPAIPEPVPELAPEPKPKRTVRRRRAAQPPDDPPAESDVLKTEEPVASATQEVSHTQSSYAQSAPILTIHAKDEVQTEDEKEDIVWHQINNAFYTRKILYGILGGVEQTDSGQTLGIIDYKGFRVVIPLKEMMLLPDRRDMSPRQFLLFQAKILGSMLGCEVDFMVKGVDRESKSVVGSRKEAMLRKRQTFYMDETVEGRPHIYENRIVQARVIGVSEKAIRVEVFGVECPIVASRISWEWIGDVRDKYHIGDQVLVRVTEIQKDDVENISITADMKSISQNNSRDNLRKCRIQSKYAGKVTDIHKGIVYVRLSNGVNAIAHTCLDFRMPGKKDDVSFAVTGLNEERGVALGIITRIIRQNL